MLLCEGKRNDKKVSWLGHICNSGKQEGMILKGIFHFDWCLAGSRQAGCARNRENSDRQATRSFRRAV